MKKLFFAMMLAAMSTGANAKSANDTLIVTTTPQMHCANLYEIEDETLAKAAKLAKKVINHEKDVLGCDGYNVVQNNGEAAGQTRL